MKIIYVLFFLLLCPFLLSAQTVTVSGKCITGIIAPNKIAIMNVKAVYQGSGNLLGKTELPLPFIG